MPPRTAAEPAQRTQHKKERKEIEHERPTENKAGAQEGGAFIKALL
jgi:hypothetical protein